MKLFSKKSEELPISEGIFSGESKLLELLNYNINAEFKAIQDYNTFNEELYTIELSPSKRAEVKKAIDEILSDEIDHHAKLLYLRKWIFGY